MDYHPVICEVEAVVKAVKKGKSVGFDNIPPELRNTGRYFSASSLIVKGGGQTVIDIMTVICNKV